MFCAKSVIHCTCRCQSGVTFEEMVGGGANNDVVKVEYVTSMERRMDKRAGRRSCPRCKDGVYNNIRVE